MNTLEKYSHKKVQETQKINLSLQFLRLLCLFVALFLANCAFGYSGGTGESNNPYQIASSADLLELGADEPNYDKSFILIDDINLAGYDFNTAVIAPHNIGFSGTFNGDCHTIRNMTIDSNEEYWENCGLFGTNSGEINNLNLENVNISIIGRYIGSLVGYNYWGTINNCHSDVNISAVDSEFAVIGGIVSKNEFGTITNCSSGGMIYIYSRIGAITMLPSVGGFVGINRDSTITDSYSTSNIIADGNLIGIGGFAAANSGQYDIGMICKCFSSGSVLLYNTNNYWHFTWVGGFLGSNSDDVNQCFSTTSVIINGIESYCTGGMVGSNNGGNISDCYSTGNVTISVSYNDIGWLGGFSGDNSGNINNCYSIGKVESGLGTGYIGGFVGDDLSGSTINSSYFLDTSGPANGNGTPLTDFDMKHQSSFEGWDFVSETINGTEDIWCIFEGYTYPKLAWYWCEPNRPVVVCPGEGGPGGGGGGGGSKFPNYDDKGIVDFSDFAIFAAAWLTENPLVSLDTDTDVDIYDLKLFCDAWLEEQ